MPLISAVRYHDFSYGHRVFGHESKCANLHGHNGRATFTCTGLQDKLGRVIDFSVIKHTLCEWLEHEWDHRFLIWGGDPLAQQVRWLDPTTVITSFNPTAENMALHLLQEIGPNLLVGTGVTLQSVRIDETRKCSAVAEI
jgi:6-pyruvoyltetrahydropterin/6-carboxytetrahydropterin synthase